MKYLPFLLLLLSCATKPPAPSPVIKVDTIYTTITKTDTQRITRYMQDTAHQVIGEVSVLDFGVRAGQAFDNANAFDSVIIWAITHPCVITLPVGTFYTSRSWLWQNIKNGKNNFFTIHLKGQMPNKSASDEYLTKIIYTGRSGYCIGIQRGRGIRIENLTLVGQYTFPNSVNNYNIGTLKFQDWQDLSITDTRNSPYCAISIDPNLNADGSRGGTSDVTIENCSIHQWYVGIAVSPNGFTQNAEMLNFLEDNIDAVRVCFAICQEQSKTVNIKGLKVWASTHTIIDGFTYGAGTGGGSVFCENWNIAGNVNQLLNVKTRTFPISLINIYSESLFRIGYIEAGCGANFINCQIDFLTGPGMPAADYIILGQANFSGGQLRYYENNPGYQYHRLNFVTGANVKSSLVFRDIIINNPPIVAALYGAAFGNTYPSAIFDNVLGYYTPFKNNFDTLIAFHVTPVINIDRTNWVGTLTASGIGSIARIGDYIIAEPTAQTRNYYDAPYDCPTKQIGRVTAIKGDSLFLDEIGLNTFSNTQFGNVYIDRYK